MPLEITGTFEYFFIAAMAMMIYAALCFVESEWKLGGQNSLCVLKLETPLPHKELWSKVVYESLRGGVS